MRVYIGLWSYAESDNDRFGSQAAPQDSTISTAAIACEAVSQSTNKTAW